MNRIFFAIVFAFSFLFNGHAQEPYQFTTVIDLETTPVISQGITGTCWSFTWNSRIDC